MLKIPEKYKRCGIKVKCLKCAYQVTNKCGLTGKSSASCKHQERHRYNLIVCVPGSKSGRRTRILDTTNFNTALEELSKFRNECEQQGYHRMIIPQHQKKETTFVYFATTYLDAISGVNTPEILIRKRSQNHIDDTRRAFERFSISLKNKGYNLNTLDMKDIGDNEVGIFHTYLKKNLNLGTNSYNKHMTILKTLYNWTSRVKNYSIPNPFNHIELHTVHREVSIITRNEFESLLSVISYDNGFEEKRKKNLYHPWLRVAYRLALETGLRREELVILKWSDLVALDNQQMVFRVDNLKVNRMLTGSSRGTRVKNIPVTSGLMKLLEEVGYPEKKDSDSFIIDRPEGMPVSYMIDLLSRSFAHFIKLVTDRPLQFSVLRKTYISHLVLSLGGNAKIFTGHSNDQVLKNHYLSSAFLAGNLSDFSVFGKG